MKTLNMIILMKKEINIKIIPIEKMKIIITLKEIIIIQTIKKQMIIKKMNMSIYLHLQTVKEIKINFI